LRAGADPYAKVKAGGATGLRLANRGRRTAKGSVVKDYETIKVIQQAQAMIAGNN